jgi:hypothetical protein
LKIANTATPVALVVLAIGTAGYAYFVDRGRVSDADRAARRTDVFPSFRVDQVRKIELVHGSETLALARDAAAGADGQSAWTMVQPRRDPADPSAVDALLRELEMAPRVRDVNEADGVGLDAPRVRGSLTVGQVTYRFVVGADALTPEGAAYMRLDGEGTFVVERTLKVQLLRGADAYRERSLVPYGANDVARLELTAPGVARVTLERRGTAFRVDGQGGLRASRAALDHLFGALADARAESFVDDAAAERAMASIVRTVVITPRDASRPGTTLVVGGACPSEDPELRADVVVVRTAPSRAAACVAGGVADALAATAASLVDDSPLMAHADEIEEVRLEPAAGSGAGPVVDLARRAGGWHERAPDEREIPPGEADSTNALVDALAGARALDVRRAAPGERFTVRARATILRTGGGASEVVEVTAPDALGVALARRIDDGAILALARGVARRFEPHPIALSAGPVWRSPVDPGAVVAVDDGCSHGPARLELDGGVWKARGVAADNLSAGDLVEAFARAKADAWVAESDDGTFGFGREGSCAVTLVLPSSGREPGRRLGLVFGAPGEGGVYARASDGPGVFVASAVLRELASHPPVDRGPFRLDLASWTRVSIERGAARIALSRARDGGGPLERAGGDAGVPEKLESALAGLRAECALHTGPATSDEGFDRPTLEIDAVVSAGAGGDDGAAGALHIEIGAPTRDGTTEGYFARAAGVDATFLVSRAAVNAVLDAW